MTAARLSLDFADTISADRQDHVIAQERIDSHAVAVLHELARLGQRTVLPVWKR
jgi:hypothetical protein